MPEQFPDIPQIPIGADTMLSFWDSNQDPMEKSKSKAHAIFEIAHKMLEDRALTDFVEERYRSYSEGIGKQIVEGKADSNSLAEYDHQHEQISNVSGRREMLESIVNRYPAITE